MFTTMVKAQAEAMLRIVDAIEVGCGCVVRPVPKCGFHVCRS